MDLIAQIDRMSALVEYAEHTDANVSAWTVGQQLEHCCLTMRAAGASIRRSSDRPAKTKLTIVGRLVFRAGRIRRGGGKAPARVSPPATPSPEDLRRSIEKARSAVAELNPENPNGIFEHPYFGQLDQKMTVEFLRIHNEHHLAIVADILGLPQRRT